MKNDVIEVDEEDDIQTLSAPKKKTLGTRQKATHTKMVALRNPATMTTEENCEDEDAVVRRSSQWKDSNVDTLIALHREIETKSCEE